MQDYQGPTPGNDSSDNAMSRREFTTYSLVAGIAAAAGTGSATAAAALTVVEKNVEIKTPSGTCDAVLVSPEGKGKWPAAILFVDAFGLRPSMRDMAKRLAADGYTVLVPNPYYRGGKSTGVALAIDFSNPADRAKLTEMRAPLTNDAVAQDAAAYLAFLDQQPSVNKSVKAGAWGYCMGGLMSVQASAGSPNRLGAAASFHGGGLVTDKPDSPHLLVPKMKGQYYFGVAANDDEKQPDAKTKLAEAFQAAKLPAKIEVYAGCLHGWCVPDMPAQAGKPIYNKPEAERAWGELVSLFKKALV